MVFDPVECVLRYHEHGPSNAAIKEVMGPDHPCAPTGARQSLLPHENILKNFSVTLCSDRGP
jgi:hypothetical protein